MALARPRAPARRATHGARTHLHSRPLLRGSRRDPRLPREHRENPVVPCPRDAQKSIARPRGHVRRKFMSPRIPDTHAEAWALLPWLANGRIETADREWVEAHVGACAECRAELAAQRMVATQMSRESTAPGQANDEQKSFNKLWARIEASESLSEATQNTGNVSAAPRASRTVRWLAAAV